MKPFDLEAAKAGAKLITRDGKEAVFIAYDPLAEGDQVAVRVENTLLLFYADGVMWDHRESDDDLFMAPTKRTVYVNFHESGMAYWFDSLEDAADMATPTTIAAAVPMEIEE